MKSKVKELSTYSVVGFEKRFPEQFDYAKKIEEANGHVICTMPVKSGKRIVMEILSQRRRNDKPQVEQHVFITALNRIDAKEQLLELAAYGIEIIPVHRKIHMPKAESTLNKFIKKGLRVIVHFDESDYGTGTKQLISTIFTSLLKFGNKCKIVHYSATNEEVEFSEFGKQAVRLEPFKPSPNYRGAKWFISNKLVKRATPFYSEGKLTEQAIEACELFNKSGKALSVLRVVDGIKQLELDDGFFEQLYSLNIEPVFVDAARSFDWEKDYGRYVLKFSHTNIRTLLVICQTCTRSTQVGFHKHICFWHDYRKKSAYNTMHQAFGRVFHYVENEIENPIKMYACPEVIECAAGLMSSSELMSKGIALSDRINDVSERKKFKIGFAKTFDEIPETAYFGEGKTKSDFNGKGSSIRNQNENDLADAVLKGVNRGNNFVIIIDGKNENNEKNQESWNLLVKKYPDKIGWLAYYENLDVKHEALPEAGDDSMYKIHFYGEPAVFEYASGDIDEGEFLTKTNGVPLSDRIVSTKAKTPNLVNIAEFGTEQDLHDFANNNLKPYKPEKFKKDENGYYLGNLRGETKKWTEEEALREKNWGVDKQTPYRKFVYYKPDNTPVFRLAWYSDKNEDTEKRPVVIESKTSGSMYDPISE